MNTLNKERNDRILVIDDNPAIHDDFRKILTGAKGRSVNLAEAELALFGDAPKAVRPTSFQIDSALQGQEGWEMVQRALTDGRPYAMAFVDVRMPPGWDGVETITRICKVDPDIQIVICTAYSDYSWEEIARNLGESDNMVILKKPFDNIEVLQLAHALTQKWSLSQQAKCKMSDLEEMVNQRTRQVQLANEKLKSEIVERQKTEEALRSSEDRFSRAFNSSPIPMAIQTLKDERFVDINNRFLQMTGLSREEIIGRTPAKLEIWIDREARGQMIEKLHKEKSVRDWPCRIRAKSGEGRETLVSLELFNLGSEHYLLTIAQDISDRLRLENQLRQAQKMEAVGKLAAGVAHDFNNILTIIQGYTSLGLSAPNLDAEAADALNEILRAAERAATLTRQLLAFSRKQLMQPKVVDLNELIVQVTSMLSRLIGEDISLQENLSEALPSVFADHGNVEQVIMNLVVNARDAMPKGGQIIVSTAKVEIDAAIARQNPEAVPGQFVCLTVADTGCGMDIETQARLFEPFFTTKEVGKGTGMGLAMVYGIIKQHGGWIEVLSQVGQGSTFKVFLPSTKLLAEASTDDQQVPEAALGGHETILVVEDEKGILELVRKVLQRRGYRILVASNAKEALDVWKEHAGEINLLLTDLVMPGGTTGLDLAEILLLEKAELKVIYTSGYSLALFGQDCPVKEGFNFLQKPYQSLLLAQTVRSCLDAPKKPPTHLSSEQTGA